MGTQKRRQDHLQIGCGNLPFFTTQSNAQKYGQAIVCRNCSQKYGQKIWHVKKNVTAVTKLAVTVQ